MRMNTPPIDGENALNPFPAPKPDNKQDGGNFNFRHEDYFALPRESFGFGNVELIAKRHRS
jgi:hypothetical protein